MNQFIDCSNPLCDARIQVLPGTTQVQCPKCQTWHFPTPDALMSSESSSSSMDTPPNDPYEAPNSPSNPYAAPPQQSAAPMSNPYASPPESSHEISSGDTGGRIVEPEIQQQNPYQQSGPSYDVPQTPSDGARWSRGFVDPPQADIHGHAHDVHDAAPPPEICYLQTDAGDKIPLKEGLNVIGRKHADILISDHTISRRHCVIEVSKTDDRGYDYHIYDIGHIEDKPSTNGVFLSGRSLRLQDYERISIRPGAAIRLGQFVMYLKLNM